MNFGDFGERLAQPIDGKAGLLLASISTFSRRAMRSAAAWNKLDHLGRNDYRAMAISVDHVVRRNNHARNAHDRSDVYDMNIGRVRA